MLAEDDYSFTGGIKGAVDGWNWDLSTTYGRDRDAISTDGSANAQLFPVLAAVSATPIAPQRDFYDGAFIATEWTTNLDIVKDIRRRHGQAAGLRLRRGDPREHLRD